MLIVGVHMADCVVGWLPNEKRPQIGLDPIAAGGQKPYVMSLASVPESMLLIEQGSSS